MVEKRLYTKWSGIWMPIEYKTARPFEYQTNGWHFVFLCSGPVFKWLVYYKEQSTYPIWIPNHLNTKPFEIWTLKSSEFKCFRYSTGRYSFPHWISIFSFLILTLLSVSGWLLLDVHLLRVWLWRQQQKVFSLQSQVHQKGMQHPLPLRYAASPSSKCRELMGAQRFI